MNPSFHLHCAQTRFKPWDNPDNLMDQETSNTIVTIINVGILPPVVLVGVVTNIINIAVFTKQVGSTAGLWYHISNGYGSLDISSHSFFPLRSTDFGGYSEEQVLVLVLRVTVLF